MEAFIIYIGKASGLIILFLAAYYVLLRKETFFTSNRSFLLAGLLTSTLLPFIEYTKVIWVAPTQQTVSAQAAIATSDAAALQQFVTQKQFITQQAESFIINWWYVAFCIYAIGVLFFLMRFVVDFNAIRTILKGNNIVREGNYKLIDSKKIQSPFSFFNYIVYNSSVLQPEELESIIAHEKVHSRQRHSADMIVSQLFCIAFWFNPFAWLYKKSISQNLEFIADAVAIKQLSDRKVYQKTLLKITLQPECIAITNHFYQSLIKKRIVMLNKKQSKRRNSWKYAIVLPALTAFMFAFQVKVVAQEKDASITHNSDENIKIVVTIDKDSKDEEMESEVKIFKQEFDTDVTFNNVKRNSSGEITDINLNVKDKNQNKNFVMSGNGPIKSFDIEIEKGSKGNTNTIFFRTSKNLSFSSGSFSTASNDTTSVNAPSKLYTSTTSVNSTSDTLVYKKAAPLKTNLDKDALVIINGVKQPKGNADKIQFNGNQPVSINMLSPKEAKEKYGKEAKKGAIEIITSKRPQVAYAYAYNQNGEAMEPFLPMPPMPPIDEIMGYASMGVQEGMKALAEIDWKKEMDFEGLSEAERKEIKEEMKRASEEIRKAFNDPEVRKAMGQKRIHEGVAKKIREEKVSREDVKAEIQKQIQAELKKTRVELERIRKELEKTKAELKKKKN